MARLWIVLSCIATVYSLTPNTYFSNVDQQRLRNLFQAAQPFTNDFQSLYYSVFGTELLGGGLDFPGKACDALKQQSKLDDIESYYFISSAQKILKTFKSAGDCAVKHGAPESVLTDAISSESSSKTLYYAAASLTNLGKKLDAAKLTKAIDAALEADDSILSHAYAFYAVTLLKGTAGVDFNKYHLLIEDMIAQADEIDDVMMRFEGGLLPTALLIDASYKLAEVAKKAPTLTDEQAIKFANYFLSRKYVQSLENAAVLLQVVKTMTNNQFQIPIVVTLASQVAVNDKFPVVKVRVSNLLGKSLGSLTVTAETARHVGDDAVVLSMKPFTVTPEDNTLYGLDFLKNKATRGFYKFAISVVSKDKNSKLIGGSGAEVNVKVTTSLSIENVEIGVGEKDQSSAIRTTKLTYPTATKQVLEADHHQKLAIMFTLVDQMTKQPMTTHQSFIRMTNQESQAEIIFVSESDNQDQYKFEMDVGANAKLFGQRSGKYSVELIVGDSTVQNPISWKLGDVQLSFADEAKQVASEDVYAKKPEINHMFREPEVRPPAVVSNLFTGLVLLPILLLFVLWAKIGVNISNFPASPIALGFHIGLGGIFALYYCYFLQLNMFVTLKYLGLVGGATFILGNRLLASIAAKRKQ